jgi:hypothetical protein
MALLSILPLRRLIPKQMNMDLALIDPYGQKLKSLDNSDEAEDLLTKMAEEACKTKMFNKEFQNELFPLETPFFFPAEVEGIRFILKKMNMRNRFPKVVYCEEL